MYLLRIGLYIINIIPSNCCSHWYRSSKSMGSSSESIADLYTTRSATFPLDDRRCVEPDDRDRVGANRRPVRQQVATGVGSGGGHDEKTSRQHRDVWPTKRATAASTVAAAAARHPHRRRDGTATRRADGGARVRQTFRTFKRPPQNPSTAANPNNPISFI